MMANTARCDIFNKACHGCRFALLMVHMAIERSLTIAVAACIAALAMYG